MPRKPERRPDDRVLVSVRLPAALVDRLEAARVDCRPVPNRQEFHAFVLDQGLKTVEAPRG